MSSYAEVPLVAKKKEDEEFQQNVHVTHKLEEFIHLLDVTISVNKKLITLKDNFHNLIKKMFSVYHFYLDSKLGLLELWCY